MFLEFVVTKILDFGGKKGDLDTMVGEHKLGWSDDEKWVKYDLSMCEIFFASCLKPSNIVFPSPNQL